MSHYWARDGPFGAESCALAFGWFGEQGFGLAEQPTEKRSGHALPALMLAIGVIVLVLVTQRALASAVAHFVAGVWVSAMELVFALLGGIFGG